MFKQAAVTGQPSKFNSESLCSPAMQRKQNPTPFMEANSEGQAKQRLWITLGIGSMNNYPLGNNYYAMI